MSFKGFYYFTGWGNLYIKRRELRGEEFSPGKTVCGQANFWRFNSPGSTVELAITGGKPLFLTGSS